MTVALAGVLGVSAGLAHCSILQRAVRQRLESQDAQWKFAASAQMRTLFIAGVLAFAASMGAAPLAASVSGYWIARSAWVWRAVGGRADA